MFNIYISDPHFDERSEEEQTAIVLRLYQNALELTSYRSFWHRVRAWARDQQQGVYAAYLRGVERFVVNFVNSSPAYQAIWKRFCQQEPADSRSKPFLPRVLRQHGSPRETLSAEERNQMRRNGEAFHNGLPQILASTREVIELLHSQKPKS